MLSKPIRAGGGPREEGAEDAGVVFGVTVNAAKASVGFHMPTPTEEPVEVPRPVPMVAAIVETDGARDEAVGTVCSAEEGCGFTRARPNFLAGGRGVVGRVVVSSLLVESSVGMLSLSGWTDKSVRFFRISGGGGLELPGEGRASSGVCAGVDNSGGERDGGVESAIVSNVSTAMVSHVSVGRNFNSGGIVAPIDWLAW